MKSLLLALSITLLASCATTIPVVVELPCPDPIELPKLPEELKPELSQVSPDLQNYFITRDKLQTARRETLQNICRSTHGNS